MNHRRCLGFLQFAACCWAASIGSPVGPLRLKTPDGISVTVRANPARAATALIYLSARDSRIDSVAATISTLNEKYRHRGVLFAGLFPDRETGLEIRAFSQASGFNFPVYVDPSGTAAAALGATAAPSAFLLDKNGNLVFRGPVSHLSRAVEAFLTGTPINAMDLPFDGAPLTKVLPPRTIRSPYGSLHFDEELIFDQIPGYPVHHCSTMTETAGGDLLASWYGGSYESSDDQAIFLSRHNRTSRQWSKPRVLVRSPGKPPGNAVLFTDDRNRVWLVWGRMDGEQPMLRGTGWDACRLFSRTSDDNGITWTEDKPFFHGTLGWLPRNLTIKLRDGSLVLPLSDERNGGGVDLSFFLSSRDEGKTWTKSGIMRGGEQPTFIERNDGSLLAYLRVRPNIVASESNDGGRTWTEPKPTKWKNPDAGISMRKLANGHVLLVFNNQDDSRTPLHIARSTDDGRTWSEPLKLESNPGEYSYPSVLQTSDGMIHIIYTFRRYSIKHIELNEDWLTKFERPD
jgi:predicted neuraminidase